MKVKMFVLTGLAMLALSSCDKIKDAASVDVTTTVSASISSETEEISEIEIPVQSVTMKSASVDGTTRTFYLFKGEAEIDLKGNADIGKYVDGIIDYKINDGKISLGGLGDGDSIYGLTVKAYNDSQTNSNGTPFSTFTTFNGMARYLLAVRSLYQPKLTSFVDGVFLSTPSPLLPLMRTGFSIEPQLSIDPRGIADFLVDWKSMGYKKVYIVVEGFSNFDVKNKLKTKVTLPSTIKYSPL